MYYIYILWSSKSGNFYYGYTADLKQRLWRHNKGQSQATKFGRPWRLVFYAAFESKIKAKEFEHYMKSGSGKAFLYKRLVNVALVKAVQGSGAPKLARGERRTPPQM